MAEDLTAPSRELVQPLRDAAIKAGHTAGILVVVIDMEQDDAGQRVIVDDVSVVTAGACYVDGVSDYPTSGTQVWTIKGRGGRSSNRKGSNG